MIEAVIAKRFFMNLGVDESRIVLEGRSLNTAQNAAFTRALVMPQPGQRWLLVTSASHMPRAVGAFRRAGFSVIPYPTGYTTSGNSLEFREFRLEASTNRLVFYWLTDRTDALFPAPEPAKDDVASTGVHSSPLLR
jgi:uncharacterized SAM-binding protein YcdF (DUF218 family)